MREVADGRAGTAGRGPRLPIGAVALVAVLLAACGSPDAPPPAEAPAPIPRPELGRVDPAVADQLRGEREVLDRLLAAPGTSRGEELGEALGRMGQRYHAYDLLVPAAACYRRARDVAGDDFRWPYYLGMVHQRLGRLEEAARGFEEALRIRPDDAAARLRLGNVELARNRPAAARTQFERALAARSDCVAARYGLGQAAAAAGDLETAVEHYRTTLAQQPQAMRVHYPLAQALLRLGRTGEARPHLEASAGRRVSVGGKASCDDPLDAELAGLTTGATVHLTRGRHASFAGDPEREIEEYRRAVAAAPEDAVARQSLASALLRRGELPAAVEHYRRAVELDPENASYRQDLALCLTGLGATTEAAAEFRAALELDPTLRPAHLKLAEIELRGGRRQQALEHSRRALALDPADREARILEIMALLSLERRSQATSRLGRLLADDPPGDPGERLRLASLLMGLGDVDRASPHFAAILELDAPPAIKARAHMRRGQVHLLRGRPQAAAASFRAALELDPELDEARAALGRARNAAQGSR